MENSLLIMSRILSLAHDMKQAAAARDLAAVNAIVPGICTLVADFIEADPASASQFMRHAGQSFSEVAIKLAKQDVA